MRRSRRCFLALAASVLAAGCETGPGRRVDSSSAWQERQRRLAGLDRWTFVGRVGVKSRADAWNARIHWSQMAERYRIRLSGPLGQGIVEIEGEPGAIELRDGEQTHRAASPEALLRDRLGWSLPLEGLRYWVLGGSDPTQAPATLELDDAGRLRRLEQARWSVEYARYVTVDGFELPLRIELESAGVNARLIISRWVL